MSNPIRILTLIAIGWIAQSCSQPALPDTEIPLSGGIQISLHSMGGSLGLNESLQVSDHWQLTSVGRQHGWVRKLDSNEQRQLVKAMQCFEKLSSKIEAPGADGFDRILTARGSGEGWASHQDAERLGQLLDKLAASQPVATASR